ncbi:MAG: hypothetical protein ACP5NI_04425 [Acetobacteraceae bacterium]
MEPLTYPTSLPDRFASVLALFRKTVGAQAAKDRLLQPLLCLLHARIGRIARRIARLIARIPAGAPPRPHRPRPAPSAPSALSASPAPSRPPSAPARPWASLPRRPGWALRFAYPGAAYARSQLQYLLADPEAAAAPQPAAPQPAAPGPTLAGPAQPSPRPPAGPGSPPAIEPPRVRRARSAAPASSQARPAGAG